MSGIYTCANCGKRFESEWSDEEVRKEAEENGFGDLPDDEKAIVCDDCYNKIMPRHKLNSLFNLLGGAGSGEVQSNLRW